MGGTKNMIRGVIATSLYLTTTIIIPFLLFRWIKNFKLPQIGQILMTQENYETIIFWLTAFGLLISGIAFFAFSSPKQSIRRGVFSLVLVIVNCLYLWSYKFSGATEVIFNIDLPGFTGFLSLDLQQMVLTYMGIYFLMMVLKVYDVIDFIINRKKIRENRMKE